MSLTTNEMSAADIAAVCGNNRGGSEFLKAIKGKSAESVWRVMDELMTIIAENDERLYEHIMSQI